MKVRNKRKNWTTKNASKDELNRLLHETTAGSTLLGGSRWRHCRRDSGSGVLGGAGVLDILLESADLGDGDLLSGDNHLCVGVESDGHRGGGGAGADEDSRLEGDSRSSHDDHGGREAGRVGDDAGDGGNIRSTLGNGVVKVSVAGLDVAVHVEVTLRYVGALSWCTGRSDRSRLVSNGGLRDGAVGGPGNELVADEKVV